MKFAPLIIFLFVIVALGVKLLQQDTALNSTVINKKIIKIHKVKNLFDTEQIINFLPEHPKSRQMIHILASWCKNCRDELLELSSFAREHQVRIIGILWNDDIEQARNWLKTYINSYFMVGIISDSDIVDLGITQVPMTYIIDTNGVVLYNYLGSLNKHIFKNDILPRLNQ